ncbi:replication initiation protein [Yangia sp. PrR003]|nr:replication initiation protein [Salipiger sp. PrR003]
MARGKYQLELQDMRVFLFLLHQSHNRDDRSRLQRVKVVDVLQYIGHTSIDLLERSLKNLTDVKIEIDYQENGVPHSVGCHFLSYDVSRTFNGYIEYAFDPILMRFIFDPKIYAKINIALFKQFRTIQGAKLFEILTLFQKRKYRTWQVSLEEFRDRLGVPADQYTRFDNLRRSVIDRAVDECNSLAPFGVRTRYIRSGRGGRVTEIEFAIIPRRELPASSVPAKTKKAKNRDALTVDMLTGHTDEEIGRDLLVSDEALDEAISLLEAHGQGDEDLQSYIDEWREAATEEDISSGPSASFLRWLRVRFETQYASKSGILDADNLEQLMMEYQ